MSITTAPAPRICRTVEGALRLDAGDVVRAAKRQRPEAWALWSDSGAPVLMSVLARLTRNGAAAGEASVMLAMDGPRAACELPDGTAAGLVAGPTNIHGIRWWWLCPRLGHLCASLFLPAGADRFASRTAHGLVYRSESEGPAERAARKARKLRARLGEAPAVLGGPLPGKPLRMRWPTYERLLDRLREAEERALSASARTLACMAPPLASADPE